MVTHFFLVEYAIYIETRYQEYLTDCESFGWSSKDRATWFDEVDNCVVEQDPWK